jgi:hypothetical protein
VNNPLVLVTMQQELKMAKRGFKSEGTPEERYSHIPISSFSLGSDGTAA